MENQKIIDLLEDKLRSESPELLPTLLIDQTMSRAKERTCNIFWATNDSHILTRLQQSILQVNMDILSNLAFAKIKKHKFYALKIKRKFLLLRGFATIKIILSTMLGLEKKAFSILKTMTIPGLLTMLPLLFLKERLGKIMFVTSVLKSLVERLHTSPLVTTLLPVSLSLLSNELECLTANCAS